jgi:hypothetical protein
MPLSHPPALSHQLHFHQLHLHQLHPHHLHRLHPHHARAMFCVTCMGQVAYSSLFLILDISSLVVFNHPHSERLTGPPPALPHRVVCQLQGPITDGVCTAHRTAGLRKGRGKRNLGENGETDGRNAYKSQILAEGGSDLAYNSGLSPWVQNEANTSGMRRQKMKVATDVRRN